jgi:hypothetical protein
MFSYYTQVYCIIDAKKEKVFTLISLRSNYALLLLMFHSLIGSVSF